MFVWTFEGHLCDTFWCMTLRYGFRKIPTFELIYGPLIWRHITLTSQWFRMAAMVPKLEVVFTLKCGTWKEQWGHLHTPWACDLNEITWVHGMLIVYWHMDHIFDLWIDDVDLYLHFEGSFLLVPIYVYEDAFIIGGVFGSLTHLYVFVPHMWTLLTWSVGWHAIVVGDDCTLRQLEVI